MEYTKNFKVGVKMICPNCGHQIPEEFYCTGCGHVPPPVQAKTWVASRRTVMEATVRASSRARQ